MDALDLLKSDHDRVRSIYEQIKAVTEPGERTGLLAQLRDELLKHARIEETVFYPAFKNYPEFQGLLADSYEDHRTIKNQLRQLSEAKDTDLARIEALMRQVDEHVREEEDSFFPKVRKMMKRSEREVLGRHLLAAKDDESIAA
jgi:hemerythrin superfamily protein